MREDTSDPLLRFRIVPPGDDADSAWLSDLWQVEWGGETVVSRGRIHRLTDQAALIAWDGDDRVGAATYWLEEGDCELTSINATVSGRGVGAALIRAVEEAARSEEAHRVWLITTNDNFDALRFYQRRGYRIAAVHVGAVDEARKLKPSIPSIGKHGIPMHDEIELEKQL